MSFIASIRLIILYIISEILQDFGKKLIADKQIVA